MKNMTNLRSKLIRLAHEKPELRPALLPILAKTADVKLTPKDKKAILAFLDHKEAEGTNISSDGKKLDGNWMGGRGIAIWEGDKIDFPDLGSRSAQTVQKAIRKEAPANWIKAAAKDEVTHWIVTTYKDSTGKEKTSKDSWLPKWGKPTKANFEKIVSKGVEDKSLGTPVEMKLIHRNETVFTYKPKTASVDKEAIRGRFTMPRSSYIPKDEPTLQQRKNTPEGLEIWTWEGYSRGQDRVVPYAIAFAGKADKPLWHHSFRDINGQERMIQETIKNYQARVDAKRQRMDEKKNFQHNIQVGDIFVASWGYEQTNIDYYKVTGLLGKAVKVREIGKKYVKSDGYGSDTVLPDPRAEEGPELKKIPQMGYKGQAYIKISDSQTAYPWDGKPDRQTSSGWGH